MAEGGAGDRGRWKRTLRKWDVVDDRPFSRRLLPWQFWGAGAFACFVLATVAVMGWGFENPSRARVVGYAVLVPLGALSLGLMFTSRRLAARGSREPKGGGRP